MKWNLEGMIYTLLLAPIVLGCAGTDQRTLQRTGQYPQRFEKEIKMHVRLPYLLYLPDAYPTSTQKWPLMLFLHGAGERGSDLQKVTVHGPPKLIASAGKQFPFIIVSPQCPAYEFWSNGHMLETLNALLDDIIARYRVDMDRIYVTGLSMGGYGTWHLALAYPERFAAIAPICGKGDPARAARLKNVPVWAFHGARDDMVPLAGSADMVDALKKAGGDVRFTIYPEAGHDAWTETYNNPKLYEWLLQHKRAAGK